MSELAQGLQLSVMGILITFVSLGFLILVIVILRELFTSKPAPVVEPQDAQDDLADYWDELRLRAAGIAVAVACLHRDRRHTANLGALLETPPAKNRVQGSRNE